MFVGSNKCSIFPSSTCALTLVACAYFQCLTKWLFSQSSPSAHSFYRGLLSFSVDCPSWPVQLLRSQFMYVCQICHFRCVYLRVTTSASKLRLIALCRKCVLWLATPRFAASCTCMALLFQLPPFWLPLRLSWRFRRKWIAIWCGSFICAGSIVVSFRDSEVPQCDLRL